MMLVSHHRRFVRAMVAIVAGGWYASSAGAAVIIFGGPAYNSITQTGYQDPGLPIPGGTAGNAAAVGYAEKFDAGSAKGTRAVRWDASGAAATELGNLGTNNSGITTSLAFAINTAGTAVGAAEKYVSGSDKGNRAVRWNASGTAATELGNLGTDSSGITSSQALALNTGGTAVGYAYKYASGINRGDRAVRWGASGTAATELGNLGTDSSGFTSSRTDAINSVGTAVGYAFKYASGSAMGYRAARWDASGSAATELGNLGTDSTGFTNSYANAVNAAGTAVGIATRYESGINKGDRAVRWDASGTAATELGNLGTDSDGVTNSGVFAINTAGTAVGAADKYVSGINKGGCAVRWDAFGTATELGNFGTDSSGFTYSSASAINTAGIAVGYAEDYDSNGTDLGPRAVAWGLDAVAIDLNTLLDPGSGWVNLSDARGISDTNWVTGVGRFDPDGTGGQAPYDRMFLLDISQTARWHHRVLPTAVPEPAGLSLVGIGSVALLSRRKRSPQRNRHSPARRS